MAAKHISAYDFGEEVSAGSYRFGLSRSPQALRALADRIEAREVDVQKVHVATIARDDSFTDTVLVIRFSESDV